MWFSASKSFDPLNDIPDLSGKVVIVTGGNAGLGFATIQHLLRHGAKVYMGARNEEKAREAIAKLEKGKGEVEWLDLDLSDPRKVKKAAEDFIGKERRLDILVNNAAITLAPYQRSHDDIQDAMMVNHLGSFIFTITLLPLLRTTAQDPSADVRVVNVSSAAMVFAGSNVRFRSREDFNDDHSTSTMSQLARYGRSKLANTLFTAELQRRFDAEGVPIITLSLHPGMVDTDGNRNIARKAVWPLGPILAWASGFTASSAKGAYTQVFAAASPIVRAKADEYRGAFLMPPTDIAKPTNPAALSADLAAELWETSEKILKEIGV